MITHGLRSPTMGVDETQQGTTPDDVETGIIASAPRNVETPQAWSHDDAGTETGAAEHVPTSWRSVYARAGLFLFSGVVLAVVVAGVGMSWVPWRHDAVVRPAEPSPSVSSPTPALPLVAAPAPMPPTSPAPAAAPVPDADTISLTPADRGYLNMLRDGGILIGNVPQFIALGHGICANRENGVSEARIADVIAAHNPQIGVKGARVEIESAEPAYCPQFNAGTWAN